MSHLGIRNDKLMAEAAELFCKRHNGEICGHCGGTGNEFYSMYRKCPACSGEGVVGLFLRDTIVLQDIREEVWRSHGVSDA